MWTSFKTSFYFTQEVFGENEYFDVSIQYVHKFVIKYLNGNIKSQQNKRNNQIYEDVEDRYNEHW